MTAPDIVDGLRDRLAELYPDLDTSGLAITGRILRLALAIESARVEHLAPFGLAPGDFDVLATLRRVQGEAGANPGLLLRSVLISSGGLSKRLDRLEAAGLVERRPDPDDRRGTLVRLTGPGTALIDEVLPSLLTAERDRVAEALSERQREQLAGLLRRLSPRPPA
jgi:DNA-binding MarR family transcriptional regulator